jgi:uncharacterized membrane protein HdeD (DUF308 family)
MMTAALAPRWWMMATRGTLALTFGGAISLSPNPTLAFVAVAFACYAMLDGAWAIAAAVSVSERGRRLAPWPVALGGVVSMVVGAAALWWPSVPQSFVQMVALWGLATGALELLAAFVLPRTRAVHWLMGTGGICSISLAVFMMLIPRADAMSIAYVVASYAIVFGMLTMSAVVQFRDNVSRALRSPVTK